MKNRPLCVLVLAVAALGGGCATQPPKAAGVIANGEYEYVTPLGSNIPVLVRKGEKPTGASPSETVSGDQATNSIRSGGGQMTPLPGQKP
ncbi:MAG: hypothetical protein RLZZ15_1353 [Verrucomicrobiota bacterium]|jgi:hypothetical protein